MTKKIIKLVDFPNDPNLTVLNDASFRILNDFHVFVEGQLIIIKAGFETDLASVPRIPVFYFLVGGKGHKAAILHDYLYASNFYSRLICDQVFYNALRETGIGWFNAQVFYRGVRIGGGKPYELYRQKIIEQNKINEEQAKKLVEMALVPIEGERNGQTYSERELSPIYTGWESNSP